jgi:hypothetical protein
VYSKLPPEFGETPTKVVFEGVEPGSPEAQLLYMQNMGEISSFQQKARQSRVTSGNSVSSMQQALPGGGQLRYTYNNGQETVHVRLNPVAGKVGTTSEEAAKTQHAEPLLAIDVVFAPSSFMSGDVFSFTQTSRSEATWVWEEGDPIPVDPHDPAFYNETFGLPDNPIGGSFGGPIEYTVGGTTTVVTSINSNRFVGPAGFADMAAHPPTRNNISVFTYTELILTDNGNYFHDAVNFWPAPANVDPPDNKIAWCLVAASTYERFEGQPEPEWHGRLGPPVTVNEKQNVRDQVFYFDTVNLVGCVGDVGGEHPARYEAVSVGTSTDPRLIPTTQLGASITVARGGAFADPPPPGAYGASFIAKPRKPIDPTEASPQPTVIDVYVAAQNTIKSNTYPGKEGLTFEADDADFTYDIKRDLSFTVQVREFIDGGGGYIVRVDPAFQKRKKHFHAPDHDQEPTIEGPSIDSDSERDESWKFAADKGWVDAGGAPADPANAKMGKLLASQAIAKTVVARDVPPRTVHSAPTFSGSVTAMTKVATIEWTPPSEEHKNGKATITPA